MQQSGQSSEATGTRDDTYDVISVVYHALQGAENCEIYADDAEDEQLRSFFQSAFHFLRNLRRTSRRSRISLSLVVFRLAMISL